MKMVNNMDRKYIVCLGAVALVIALAGCVQTPLENGEATDDSLSNLLEKGTLTVGSDIPYTPMEYFDEFGEAVGLDIDVVTEIAESLGVSLEIIDYDWKDIFDALQLEEVDIIISSITILPEREEEYNILFSNPYFVSGQVIVINASNDNITVPENLSGLKVGAQINTTSIEEALKYTDETLVFGYDNYEEYEDKGIVYDLKNGTLDAIIVDYPVAIKIVQSNPSLKIAGDQITEELFGIATKQGNNALIDEINEILRQMQMDDTLDNIVKKWTET